MNTDGSCKCNSCNMVKDVFVLYHDGALSDETLKEVRAHLASCEDCAKYYKEMAKSHRLDAEAKCGKNGKDGKDEEELPIPKSSYEDLARRLRKEKIRGRILCHTLYAAALIGGMTAAVLICRRRAETGCHSCRNCRSGKA